MRAIPRFLSFFIGGRISKSLSLGIFVAQIPLESPVGIPFFDPKSPLEVPSLVLPKGLLLSKSPFLSLLFLYLNEKVSWGTFRVLSSLMMILPAIFSSGDFGLLFCHILGMGCLTSDIELTYNIACSYRSSFPDRDR